MREIPARLMKQTRVACIFAAIALAVAGFAAPLFADDAATIDLLCGAPWKFTGQDWGGNVRTRVFGKDGTFTTQESERETGTWAITGNTIVLTFKGNGQHKDVLSLPLNPLGSSG